MTKKYRRYRIVLLRMSIWMIMLFVISFTLHNLFYLFFSISEWVFYSLAWFSGSLLFAFVLYTMIYGILNVFETNST